MVSILTITDSIRYLHRIKSFKSVLSLILLFSFVDYFLIQLFKIKSICSTRIIIFVISWFNWIQLTEKATIVSQLLISIHIVFELNRLV